MWRFHDLKINTKLNLILLTLLVGLFLLAGFLTYRNQRTMLLNVALEHARGIATQIIETRAYMAEVIQDEPEKNYGLIPEVVATEIAERLTAGSPYSVRQISLRYRNPDNRPDDYETVQLKNFAGESAKENYQIRNVEGAEVFRYMLRMVAEDSCLRCHGAFAEAPKFVQQRFPAGHPSYNYKPGEIIGAISVNVPLAGLFGKLSNNLMHELFSHLVMLLLIFATSGLLIRRFITNPVRLASNTMCRVAKTGSLAERIPVRASDDEIGELFASFNQMMEALARTNLQRQESEDRYHNLIEAAETGIITFLADGKIVISNHLAETLLALPKLEILGTSIFDLLENGQVLQAKIANLSSADKGTWAREAVRDRIRGNNNQWIDVEVTLILASETDQVPMYTVLLKKGQ